MWDAVSGYAVSVSYDRVFGETQRPGDPTEGSMRDHAGEEAVILGGFCCWFLLMEYNQETGCYRRHAVK